MPYARLTAVMALMLLVALAACGTGAVATPQPSAPAAAVASMTVPAPSAAATTALLTATIQPPTTTPLPPTATLPPLPPTIIPTRVSAATPGTPVATRPAGGSPTVAVARKQYGAPPPLTIDPNKQYIATIRTNQGDIVVALNAKDAPVTVNNFVFLAREGFYDGVIFHRVLPGFVIQGGDPTGTGTGGPGYRFADEPVKGKYEIGSVAMANSGPNTNGSQFFICEGQRCTSLPPSYSLFGKVSAGQEVVTRIANVPTTTGGDGAQSKPIAPVVITTIEITEQ